ncbi:hypothetical protein WJX73_002770 [Symbiochloris irregularis]|uniref:FAD-binding PCMH-type domain-containing protein n=1 Tax=Symbiochloris irregularis TaxID=706552 RepID=A0AAW1NQ48_9CHLO
MGCHGFQPLPVPRKSGFVRTSSIRIAVFIALACAVGHRAYGQTCQPQEAQCSASLKQRLQSIVHGRVYEFNSSDPIDAELLDVWLEPGDPQDFEKTPALVLGVSDVNDVVTAVKFAQQSSLSIGTRGAACSIQKSFIPPNGLMLDMSDLRQVIVDPEAGVAIVQGGVSGADVEEATKPYGIAVPWGDALTTGMGLALHGGIGYSSRAYGLTTDSILNATLVLANGSVVTANETHNADLLQGLHGAGSIFGVVVEAALQLYDVSYWFGGYLLALDDAQGNGFKAVHEWAQEAMVQQPTMGVEIFRVSTLKAVQPQLPDAPGLAVIVGDPGSYLNQGAEARASKEATVKLLLDLPIIIPNTSSIGKLDYYLTELIVTSMSPPFAAGVWISAIARFDQDSDEFLDLVTNLTYQTPPGIVADSLYDYLGSTVVDNAVKNTSSFTCFHGEVDYHFFIQYSWPIGGDNAANFAFAESARQAIEPFVIATQPYVNLATVVSDGFVEVQVGGAKKLEQLRALKASIDPTNVFSQNPFKGLWVPSMRQLAQAE